MSAQMEEGHHVLEPTLPRSEEPERAELASLIDFIEGQSHFGSCGRYLLRWGLHYLRRNPCAEGQREVLRAAAALKDLYLKVFNYALIQRIALGAASVLALLVIGWPLVDQALLSQMDRTTSHILHSAFAAFGAALAYVYLHYKRRQTTVEGYMRIILFGEGSLQERAERAAADITALDDGLSFEWLTGWAPPAERAGGTPAHTCDE